ncbi:GntR family transcriptional regulator [Siccirubricoccus phaeus]|uniref:GntR family transcriptional regulator n=1 Tax=Siccirubricoccus phaeus TaxID=2595053 RepID=UPI00165BD46A|nr:GntR family transcriptional regulator [Siccirubricoccus phaeus]
MTRSATAPVARKEAPAGPPTPVGSVEEQVYRELRDRFMSGVFLPGQVLTLRNLAADLGVSPMPVRQAVRCLIVEGALEILPNRIMQVPRMTRDRLVELLGVRRALEGMATEAACRAITLKQISAIEKIHHSSRRAFESGDMRRSLAMNQRFHFTLYEAAHSTVLMPIIQGLWLQAGPFMHLAFSSTAGAHWDGVHHVELLQALRDGDPAAARQAIERDINKTAEALLVTPHFAAARAEAHDRRLPKA